MTNSKKQLMTDRCQAQPNNAANIMMKNLMDLCIGVLAFYVFGYTIAYGETEDVGIADAGPHAVGVSVRCWVHGISMICAVDFVIFF